jgi:hypothetical protein
MKEVQIRLNKKLLGWSNTQESQDSQWIVGEKIPCVQTMDLELVSQTLKYQQDWRTGRQI